MRFIVLCSLTATVVMAAPPVLREDQVAPCKKSKSVYEGSLHAAVAYSTPISEPVNGKSLQVFECNREPVALYLFDFATADEAQKQAQFFGARLWGSGGRSADHPDEVMTNAGWVAIVSAQDRTPLTAALRNLGFSSVSLRPLAADDATYQDPSDEDLKKWKAAANCSRPKPHVKRYCLALEAFAKGSASNRRAAPIAGASLFIAPGTQKHLAEEASFLVLQEKEAIYGTVSPSNAEEAKQVETYLETLRTQRPVPKNDGVLAYVGTLATKSGHSMRTVGKSLSYVNGRNQVFIRETKHGGFVVIERADDGSQLYVGIMAP